MKLPLALLGACVLLSACAGAPGGASPIPSGGAAGFMGPGYCQAPPANANDRWQWDDLCFPSD